jgi:ribosomal protein S13
MAWKVKKEYEGKSVPNCNFPLNDLTQKQIKKLGSNVRNSYFIEEKQKKKKNVEIKREI